MHSNYFAERFAVVCYKLSRFWGNIHLERKKAGEARGVLFLGPIANHDGFALFFDHYFLFLFPAQFHDEVARDGCCQRGFAAFG